MIIGDDDGLDCAGEKEREGRSGMDGWIDGGMGECPWIYGKEKKKKERRNKEERCLEQPHARTMIV